MISTYQWDAAEEAHRKRAGFLRLVLGALRACTGPVCSAQPLRSVLTQFPRTSSARAATHNITEHATPQDTLLPRARQSQDMTILWCWHLSDPPPFSHTFAASLMIVSTPETTGSLRSLKESTPKQISILYYFIFIFNPNSQHAGQCEWVTLRVGIVANTMFLDAHSEKTNHKARFV